MSHHYHFSIQMTCSGCSGAIDRVLKRLDGIDHYSVSLESQTADIYTTPSSELNYGTTLSKIAKTGKKVNSGTEDGEVRSVDVKDFE